MIKNEREKCGTMKNHHQTDTSDAIAIEVVTEVGQTSHNQVERCKENKPKEAKAKKKKD